MDFKQKLGLLRPPRAPEKSGDRALVLEELRKKMDEILERERPVARPPADPSRSLLPFAREEGKLGVLYRRCHALLPSHHVGRIPADAANPERALALVELLRSDTARAGMIEGGLQP